MIICLGQYQDGTKRNKQIGLNIDGIVHKLSSCLDNISESIQYLG
jgi:hypothetical protein